MKHVILLQSCLLYYRYLSAHRTNYYIIYYILFIIYILYIIIISCISYCPVSCILNVSLTTVTRISVGVCLGFPILTREWNRCELTLGTSITHKQTSLWKDEHLFHKIEFSLFFTENLSLQKAFFLYFVKKFALYIYLKHMEEQKSLVERNPFIAILAPYWHKA